MTSVASAIAAESVSAGSPPVVQTNPHETAMIMKKIADFSLDHVTLKYAKDFDVPIETAKEHEKELKRYFQLAAINPQNDYGMTGPVDDIWHTFILHTKDYAAFCQDCVGRFLHHYPDRYYEGDVKGDNVETNDTLEWYGMFLRDYSIVFGETPPKHIWPNLEEFTLTTGPTCRVCGTDPSDDPGGPDISYP